MNWSGIEQKILARATPVGKRHHDDPQKATDLRIQAQIAENPTESMIHNRKSC